MELILLSSPKSLKKEPGMATKLLEAGLMNFHLRKPDFSAPEMADYLRQIPEEFHSRLVIHNHYELMSQFKLKGIHLPEFVRKQGIDYKSTVVSSSFHDLQVLENEEYEFEYVFLSPIFDSVSKIGYKAAFPEEEIRQALLKTKQRVVALGGINRSKIERVVELGFEGIAVLGTVWDSKDPMEAFQVLRDGVKLRQGSR